ncbi:hypothetical protein SAMN04488003_12514 [Loktanella fryxellensis]|uniref:Uncharacterized protein n=1 Tax=Loktanella fryxellensis TaxID=245187 RepID=A0A1H8ID99_9RHOB|nr:hypothetical protein [Loktanella fryxellensis]SEN66269.1 hypothetical protein SAMN04488003_12514 [Loktanella fryxellensis]
MTTMTVRPTGLATLVLLTWDRLLMTAALVAALYAGAWVALI